MAPVGGFGRPIDAPKIIRLPSGGRGLSGRFAARNGRGARELRRISELAFEAQPRREQDRYAAIVRDANIKIEQ